MVPKTFWEKLKASMEAQNSALSIGLDPVEEQLPPKIRSSPFPFYEFNLRIVDATWRYAAAYKLNSAFYEARGNRGIEELQRTLEYIRTNLPHIPTILDAKRADVAHTNRRYGTYSFEYLGADGLTLWPYVGKADLEVFWKDWPQKGFFFVVRTSGMGASDFQEQLVGETPDSSVPLYLYMGKTIVEKWGVGAGCFLVVGASPEPLQRLRQTLPHTLFLVPGLGVQGGKMEEVLQVARGQSHLGLLLHYSRTILYPTSEDKLEEVVEKRVKAIWQHFHNTLHKVKELSGAEIL